MNIRFSPFRSRSTGPADDLRQATVEPLDPSTVPTSIDVPKSQRSVTIIHPEQSAAYQLKAALLATGHREVDTFLLPESFMSSIATGYRPHVVLLHDFILAGGGLTGVEVARLLRTEHGYRGLLFSTSPDHAGMSNAALEVHGFSGHANAYLKR